MNADIGLVGLGVMGQNLALNLADHGFRVAVFNRNPERTREFISSCERDEPSAGRLIGSEAAASFVASIIPPRKIILMVKAGEATDSTIDGLLPHLSKGDILIDGGNAFWPDTERRSKALSARGIEFVGCGVSGGEVGARFGPSLMLGGSETAWSELRPFWEAIGAKVDDGGLPVEGAQPGVPVRGGQPCAGRVGPGGAGHFVKMVHNGIEYIDMQLIAEVYWLLRQLGGIPSQELAGIFRGWNSTELSSYLIEITADILAQPDPTGEGLLVDHIVDAAGQKGTGQWTATAALELGIPANGLAEAVFARHLSALKEERIAASEILAGPAVTPVGDRESLINQLKDSLLCAKISAYAQGFQLLAEAGREQNWNLDFAALAELWRGGCIIRAIFLQRIAEAYRSKPDLANLMLAPYFREALARGQQGWRSAVALSAHAGIASPALSACLAYYDGYRSARSSACLIQAQRDFFGAHTYERTDHPRGVFFHLDWPAEGRPEIRS